MTTTPYRSCFLAFVLLGACINTNPDVGDDDDGPGPAVPTATVTGVVEIDSAIQHATVFIDYNDNNFPDDGEPTATTDATGHFTLSWVNDWPVNATMIGAVVDSSSTRAGATGSAAAINFGLHMRAPLAGTSGAFTATAVVSPLSTLVATELDHDATLTPAAAQAKIAGAIAASHLPLSGQPLDVMADYVGDAAAGTATSADSAQLRYVAGAVASIVSSAVDAGNAAQSTFDCNDVEIFDPAIVALDQQLTAIADGTFQFSQLTAAQQANVAQDPGSYPNYFVDGTSLATAIENELEADADSLAADLFSEIADKFAEQFEDECVEIVAEELIGELLE